MESALYGVYTLAVLYQKSHLFTSLTCSISDTPQLVCKHHTRALSMKYSIYMLHFLWGSRLDVKALANEDTLLPTQMFPRLPARATFVADTNFVSGTQKCFWFCSETFCVLDKCFPVCAAQETSWAKMCPQQCVLTYQGLNFKSVIIKYVWPECVV